MDDDLYWIWISRMKNLDYERFSLLIKKYGNISTLWYLNKDELVKNTFLTADIIKDFINPEYKRNLDKINMFNKNNNINLISCKNNKYPIKLKYIFNRPIVLYVKGDISIINNEAVGIVGSRNCTEYGLRCCNYFSKELAKRGVTVITGLAKGIDSMAHKACLSVNGYTIAVVGNGLDNIYPYNNQGLADKITEKDGLIISEYPVGTYAQKINFPRRNRIISGLSSSVIVVEASLKSGALITANYAIEQGKEVWAIPGSIYSNTSVGCNQLIKDGANVLTSINDILV